MLAKVEHTVLIFLDGDPKGKGRPRFGRVGNGRVRTFTDPKTRNYEAALRWAAQEAMIGRNPYDQPLIVHVNAYMPIAISWPKWKQQAARDGRLRATGKPDIDNILKTLDALNGVVWRDDSQIFQTVVAKLYSDKPRLEIRIEIVEQATQ